MEHYDKMGDYEGVVAIAERPDLKPPINRGRFNKKQYCYLIIMLFSEISTCKKDCLLPVLVIICVSHRILCLK